MKRRLIEAAAAMVTATVLAAGGQGTASAVAGGLNRSFGTGGYVATRLGAQTSPGVSMDRTMVQSDGKLVAGGSVDGHPAVARFNANGSPDTAFGSGGVARLSTPANFTGVSAALGVGGRILVAGATDIATTKVVAFTAAGAVDASFGSGGVATIANFAARRLAVQADGRVVLAGGRGSAGELVRLMPTGSVDPSFGSGGAVGNADVAEFEAVAVDGTKIVAGGTKGGSASQVQARLARYTSTGALDASFGAGGEVAYALQPSFVSDLAVAGGSYAVAIGSDQKTVAAKFDGTGAKTWDVTVPVDGQVGITVDGSGNVSVVGDDNRSSASGRTEAVVAQLRSDGSKNSAFGCNGVSSFNWGNDFSAATGAVALSDGSVVVTGSTAGFEGEQKELVLAKLFAADPANTGYRMMNLAGDTEAFGAAAPCRTGTTIAFVQPPVDMASLPGGQGDWMVAADGGVFAFGSARFFGSMGGRPLNAPVVGMAPAADGQGYWLVAEDGGVFAFGSARFFGSMGGHPLNEAIVGMAAAPDGQGYWLAAADGGVFAFGSARFHGSMGGRLLQAPVIDMAASSAEGYWLLGMDGGIFAFGTAPFVGSMGGRPERGTWVALAGFHEVR